MTIQNPKSNPGAPGQNTDAYDYDLPRPLIAQYPLAKRSDARLMVVDRAEGSIQHRHVRDLPDLLRPHGEVTDAFRVVYPPLALAAQVWGEVSLIVSIRGDGTVIGVNVESGPPMLRATAIQSAQKSSYACIGSVESGAVVRLRYSFKLGRVIGCADRDVDHSYPRFVHSDGTVTIEAQSVGICDPAGELTSVGARSARCLFLWHCGRR